jgi:hypothetical protein
MAARGWHPERRGERARDEHIGGQRVWRRPSPLVPDLVGAQQLRLSGNEMSGITDLRDVSRQPTRLLLDEGSSLGALIRAPLAPHSDESAQRRETRRASRVAAPLTSGRRHQRRAHARCGRTPSTLAAAPSTTATAHVSGRAARRYAYFSRTFKPAPDLGARVTRPFFATSRPARSLMSAELPCSLFRICTPASGSSHPPGRGPRATTPRWARAVGAGRED